MGPNIDQVNSFYQEYSVPGGIDKNKIMGYRECEIVLIGDIKSVKSSNVFIRKNINPMLANQIAEAFLFKDEYIASPIKEIIQTLTQIGLFKKFDDLIKQTIIEYIDPPEKNTLSV